MPRRSLALPSALDLAREQGGVITRAQAIGCGLTPRAIAWQLRHGQWQYAFAAAPRGKRPGVYVTFSGPADRTTRLWAAVLVGGEGAVLSHESAAEVHGLIDQPLVTAKVHITVPTTRRVKPPTGVVAHRSSKLAEARHPVKAPPCTRVEHTIVDLTQAADDVDSAAAIIAQAVQRRLTTHDRVTACLATYPKLRWRRELREICGDVADGVHSLLELHYARGVEQAHGLPKAERQVRRKADGRGYIVDNRYRKYRVRVELDGQRGHSGDGVFRDMWRDNAAAIDGDQQLRFGWSDVDERRCETAALVGAILGFPPEPCGPECRAPARYRDLRHRAA